VATFALALLAMVVLVGAPLECDCDVDDYAKRPGDSPQPARLAEVAATILRNGRLAALPGSAEDLHAHCWTGVFSGQCYLRFRAPPSEIDRFLADSPSLSQVEPVVFRSSEGPSEHPASTRHHGFEQWTEGVDPDWYRRALPQLGRGYRIPPLNDYNWGEVVVDDAADIVYVTVIWS
jgi:hypothetical protein